MSQVLQKRRHTIFVTAHFYSWPIERREIQAQFEWVRVLHCPFFQPPAVNCQRLQVPMRCEYLFCLAIGSSYLKRVDVFCSVHAHRTRNLKRPERLCWRTLSVVGQLCWLGALRGRLLHSPAEMYHPAAPFPECHGWPDQSFRA